MVNCTPKSGGQFGLESGGQFAPKLVVNLHWNRVVNLTGFSNIRIGNKDVSEYQLERDSLNEQLVNTYRGAPKTINKAYKIASRALQKNEEFTFSDEEIDKFLPESLRKSN
ncbi:MAG: hypothetical protein RIT22_1891 [Bacteroidota bacterium]